MLKADTQIKNLNLKDLTLDKTVQMRAGMNRSAIAEYADRMEARDQFPPIIVYTKWGDKKWVADGFHRVLARRKTGARTIEAEVRHGGKRDAQLYAAQANRLHGVRVSQEDKRKMVIVFLNDREWSQWSDGKLADTIGVSASMVGRYRGYLGEKAQSRINEEGRIERKFVTKAGKGEVCPYCGQHMPGAGKRIR